MRDSVVCENKKPLPSDMPVCDLLEKMLRYLKSRIVILSIQSSRGGKLVKLAGERGSYDIGGLLTEGRKGLTPILYSWFCAS
jgi:hypothetical protein